MAMKVFALKPVPDKYQLLSLSDEQAEQRLDWFAGKPIGDSWVRFHVEVLRDEEYKNRQSSDFPSWGGVPVFSRRAVDALRDLLEPNGEILALDCPDGEYFAYNVTRVVDALDELASDVKRFRDGDVMRILRHSFHPKRVAKQTIFKIPQFEHAHDIYVTDGFVAGVKTAGLIGFEFRELWSTAEPTS